METAMIETPGEGTVRRVRAKTVPGVLRQGL